MAHDGVLVALAEQQAELAALLDVLTDEDWSRQSRCEGWSVADVVLHLAQTNELAVASARRRFTDGLTALAGGVGPPANVDEGADAMVAHERGAPPSEVRARWDRSVHDLQHALEDCDPHARVTWVAGELSARTLSTTRLAETWIHTGDVAAAVQWPQPSNDRLWHIARLAWRTLPYAFARAGRELHGPVAFHLRGPRAEPWDFRPEGSPLTTITGDALELCLVAGQRAVAADTSLRGDGPDGDAVLELVRTFA